MCGIAGLIGEISSSHRIALKRMSDAMIHRGPDDEGFWEASPNSNGWGAMLSHRRLSILDLSPSGAQPMVDSETGDVVVQNGEIYNFIDLRTKLEARGHHVHSSGDAAVMLRALSISGPTATSSMRGMFAFAFWNVRERRLLLARDALGIKPLYFVRNSDRNGKWSIAFASEVRALLASGLLVSPRLNPGAVASVVWNGFVAGPETAVSGIEQLWPGEQIQFSDDGDLISRSQHWTPPAFGEGISISEADLEHEIEQSVKLHLASDVPLGVFLSGGVDSSAIANLAQRGSDAPINTFTLAFEESSRNEGEFARKIANAIGTRHREIVLSQQHFVDHLDSSLNSLDQPSFDGLNSYFMSQAVRDAGFKVALVGTGGDELFGGYTSFREIPLLQRIAHLTRGIPLSAKLSVARGASKLMHLKNTDFAPQKRWAKLPDIVRCKDDLLALYQFAYALFLPSFQTDLLSNLGIDSFESVGLSIPMQERLLHETKGRTALQVISILEQRLFLGERLLRDTDAVSMAASIEIRLPLVDQVVFEKATGIPDAARFLPVGRKEFLRRVGLRGLSANLFERPKSGFELPYNEWMKSILGTTIEATFNDRNAVTSAGLNFESVLRLWNAFKAGTPGLYWSRIWALYVHIRWCHQNHIFV